LILAWAAGIVILLPAITQPLLAFALVAAVVAVWLASRSIAYPLALAFAPSLVEAIYGSNPLPTGGTTFLFLGWIGLAIAIAVARGMQPRTLLSTPVVLTLALVVLMLIRLSGTLDPSYGSKKLQLFIANNLVFVIAGVFVGAQREQSKRFYALLLTIATAGALLLLGQLATGAASNVVANRFSISAQEYPIQLGRSASDGMLLAIYGMLAWRSLGGRLAAMAAFPALAVALIAAGSRGPVLAFFVGLLALLALAAASGRARTRLTRVAAVVLGAVVLVPFIVPGSTVGRALSAIFGGATGLSTSGRSGLWAQAISNFSARPLSGIGTGGFGGLGTGELYPHNILLEAAVELGVVGLVIVAWLIVASLRRMIAAWRTAVGTDRLEASMLMALFMAALVNALFSGAVQDNRELWLWAGLGLGMLTRRAARPDIVSARETGPDHGLRRRPDDPRRDPHAHGRGGARLRPGGSGRRPRHAGT
jgi:O-antigen ligase